MEILHVQCHVCATLVILHYLELLINISICIIVHDVTRITYVHFTLHALDMCMHLIYSTRSLLFIGTL